MTSNGLPEIGRSRIANPSSPRPSRGNRAYDARATSFFSAGLNKRERERIDRAPMSDSRLASLEIIALSITRCAAPRLVTSA